MFRYAAMMVLAAGVLTGCVSIKYEGDSYPPTVDVKLFEDRTLVPEDFVTVGRCVAYGRYDTFTKNQICEKIRTRAGEAGADAVYIYAYQVVPESVVTGAIEQVWDDSTSGTVWHRMDRDFASYGQIGKDTTSAHAHSSYMRVLRAQFLKDPARMTEPVRTESGNLEKITLDPQPLAPPAVEPEDAPEKAVEEPVEEKEAAAPAAEAEKAAI